MADQDDLPERRVLALRVELVDGIFDRRPQSQSREGRRVPRAIGEPPELEMLPDDGVALQIIDQIGPAA